MIHLLFVPIRIRIHHGHDITAKTQVGHASADCVLLWLGKAPNGFNDTLQVVSSKSRGQVSERKKHVRSQHEFCILGLGHEEYFTARGFVPKNRTACTSALSVPLSSSGEKWWNGGMWIPNVRAVVHGWDWGCEWSAESFAFWPVSNK